MNNKIGIYIVTVPKRLQQALDLLHTFQGKADILVDEGYQGAAYNHLQALKKSNESDNTHALILEDDAQPVPQFLQHVTEWIKKFPEELISYYLGTSRPPQWQPIVEKKIAEAETPWIKLPELIHGVSYSLPTSQLPKMMNQLNQLNLPADFLIGAAWRNNTGKQILYTYPSYVEHADGETVERHVDSQPRTQPRKARKLYNEK